MLLSPKNEMRETMGSFLSTSEKADNYRKKLDADNERILRSCSAQIK